MQLVSCDGCWGPSLESQLQGVGVYECNYERNEGSGPSRRAAVHRMAKRRLDSTGRNRRRRIPTMRLAPPSMPGSTQTSVRARVLGMAATRPLHSSAPQCFARARSGKCAGLIPDPSVVASRAREAHVWRHWLNDGHCTRFEPPPQNDGPVIQTARQQALVGSRADRSRAVNVCNERRFAVYHKLRCWEDEARAHLRCAPLPLILRRFSIPGSSRSNGSHRL